MNFLTLWKLVKKVYTGYECHPIWCSKKKVDSKQGAMGAGSTLNSNNSVNWSHIRNNFRQRIRGLCTFLKRKKPEVKIIQWHGPFTVRSFFYLIYSIHELGCSSFLPVILVHRETEYLQHILLQLTSSTKAYFWLNVVLIERNKKFLEESDHWLKPSYTADP